MCEVLTTCRIAVGCVRFREVRFELWRLGELATVG